MPEQARTRRELLPQGQPDRAARARAAHDRRARRPRDAREYRAGAGIRAPGPPASACWSPSAPTSRASAWCAPASAWRGAARRVDRGLRRDARPAAPVRRGAQRAHRALRLAESLGAEAVTLSGRSAGEALAEYARERNVTRIVIGRPRRRLWRRLFIALDLRRAAGQDRGHRCARRRRRDERRAAAQPVFSVEVASPGREVGEGVAGYAWGAAAIALCTALGHWMSPAFELVNIVMVYLLAVVAGRGALRPRPGRRDLDPGRRALRFLPGAAAAHVRGHRHPVPADVRVMLVVALIIANLTASVRAGERSPATASGAPRCSTR